MRIPAAEWDAAYARHGNAADWLLERRRILRWLRVDPATPGSDFAALPFVRLETDDGPALAAAVQPPMIFVNWPERPVWSHAKGHHTARMVDDHPCPDRAGKCADDSMVVLVDRDTVHRERGAALILPDGDDVVLYTDAAAWARDWAAARLLFIARMAATERDYLMQIHEPADACLPGALLIGFAAKVRWPTGVSFRCPDETIAKAVQSAIYKHADLSRAVVAPRPSVAA